MMPSLVTGASGFVGWHIARKLVERGCLVRALVRQTSRLRELDGVEVVTGDLRDAESLRRAVAGCGRVFHAAADYRLWASEPKELYQSNVDGTRNLLAAAREAGVGQVVYTSTVGCIGIPVDGEGDERTPVTLDDMSGPYKRSKFLAEQAALEFAAGGFPVVIVNPTAPVGDPHPLSPEVPKSVGNGWRCRRSARYRLLAELPRMLPEMLSITNINRFIPSMLIGRVICSVESAPSIGPSERAAPSLELDAAWTQRHHTGAFRQQREDAPSRHG